jgi:hypothetical protein
MSNRTVLAIVMALAGARAGADIINPMEDQCRGQAPGAACSAGTCVASTCGRNNYSAGSPSRYESWPCLVCAASAAATPSLSPGTLASPKAGASPTIPPTSPAPGIVAGLTVVVGGILFARRWHRPKSALTP